jgi:hypothetical protein
MWFGRSITDRSVGVDCIPLYAVKFFNQFSILSGKDYSSYNAKGHRSEICGLFHN